MILYLNTHCAHCRDMSGSSIESLPTSGLQGLHTLILRNVPSLQVFPLVIEMSAMKRAELTYPYHCCAFAHPDKQDKDRYAEFERYIQQDCMSTSTTTGALLATAPSHEAFLPLRDTLHSSVTKMKRIKRSDIEWAGVWSRTTIDPDVDHTKHVQCGTIVRDPHNVTCTPLPDAFNPCEDIMGYMWLRVVVWFVVITALLGNSVVLLVTALSKYKLTVAKFLMCNLSFADFCLGFYLLLLAGFDASSSGHYFSVAFPWQYGGGCQAAGFLATFSVCLGVYTLAVITMERWYAICYAIDLSKRIRMKKAYVIMAAGYLYSFLVAVLPLLGISGYSKTSICLPMEVTHTIDVIYVILLLLFNATVFSIIFVCYIDMYRQVRGNNTAAGRSDANIAKRMSILVFTDFACFFPMAFFGLTAAAGRPLITITDSKILLVFFFPLNSCANPFLYAIFTNQFKKDWQGLLTRCGLKKSSVAQPRVQWNQHISLSQSRNPHRTCSTVTTLLSSSLTESRSRARHDSVPRQPDRAERVDRQRESKRLSIVLEASHMMDEDPPKTEQHASTQSTAESVDTEHDVITSDVSPDTADNGHPESTKSLTQSTSRSLTPRSLPSDYDMMQRGEPDGEDTGTPVDDLTLVDDYYNNDDLDLEDWPMMDDNDDKPHLYHRLFHTDLYDKVSDEDRQNDNIRSAPVYENIPFSTLDNDAIRRTDT